MIAGAAPAVTLRSAGPSDVAALEALIEASARALSRGFYTPAQAEAAIAHVFGVDNELIDDGTYLLAEVAGEPVGCGGWSRRRTLFGADRVASRDSGLLDPATEAARIRAFFVDPAFARRAIGHVLLEACEAAALSAGFSSTELLATLPGVPFYAAHGYVPGPAVGLMLGGVEVPFVPMRREIVAGKQQAPENGAG